MKTFTQVFLGNFVNVFIIILVTYITISLYIKMRYKLIAALT